MNKNFIFIHAAIQQCLPCQQGKLAGLRQVMIEKWAGLGSIPFFVSKKLASDLPVVSQHKTKWIAPNPALFRCKTL